MSLEHELDSELPADERQALSRLADRLERERPVPGAVLRGELRRLLISRSRSAAHAQFNRTLATSYVGLGFLCLAVAAAGLAGAGPFAA